MSTTQYYIDGYCSDDNTFLFKLSPCCKDKKSRDSTQYLLSDNLYVLRVAQNELFISNYFLNTLYKVIDNNDLKILTDNTIVEDFRFFAHRDTGVIIELTESNKGSIFGGYGKIENIYVPHGDNKLKKIQECIIACDIKSTHE